LAGVPLDALAGADAYAPEMTRQVHARLLDLGLPLARQGYTVIPDARYNRRALRRDAIERARAAGVPIQILHCVALEPALWERLDARRGDDSDATADLPDRQRARTEAFDETELPVVAR
jgi:predicted kinase